MPRAPGAHDDRGSLAAHRCTKPVRESILIRKVLHGLCRIHYKQWRRQGGYIAIWTDPSTSPVGDVHSRP